MRRVLLFLLLLALGFALLRFFTADGEAARRTGARPPRPPVDAPPVRLDHGQIGIGVQIYGAFRIGQHRDIAAGEGTVRQPIYDLSCKDCRPLGGGRHRLDGVEVALFDDGVHAADLLAGQAIVELQQDQHGQPSIRADKQLDLRDAVFRTAPGARSGPLRLEVGHVLATITDESIALDTPDDGEPVTVVGGGDQPATLRGHGLSARLPRVRTPGARMDVLLQRESTLSTREVEVRARGPMRYAEELHDGAALLTVEQDVQLDLAQGRSDAGTAGPLQVRGDRLRGWLLRQARAGRPAAAGSELVWDRLRLDGAPAAVAGAEFELQSPRLDVLPGPGGEPFVVTARGGASTLRQKSADARADATFHGDAPIRLVRPGQWLGTVHRGFGFPAAVLQPVLDLEVLVLEGAPDFAAGDGLSVHADRGLRIWRLAPRAPDGAVIARGFGNVRIESGTGGERTVATGDAGFELRRTAAGDALRLGADDPRAPQQFVLQRGGDEPLRLSGTGACLLERDQGGQVRVRLQSRAPAIEGRFAARGGELRHADALAAAFRGQELLEFCAEGARTELVWTHAGTELQAFAPRVEQTSASSWRLSGSAAQPARLHRAADDDGPDGELLAPCIDVHRLAGEALLVDATAGLGARARAAGTWRGGRVDVAADRIRLLPFAVGPAALLRRLLLLPRGLADVVAADVGGPWLLATGRVRADAADATQGDLHGEGQLLALCQAARSALLIGDEAALAAAVLHSRRPDGREFTTAGARLLCFRSDGDYVRVLTTFPGRGALLPPKVTFRDPHGSATDPLANLQGECAGEIEVLPASVLFHGPVTAHTLLPDGSEDPRGMHVTARHLLMTRLPETGAVARIEASDGATVDWRELHARSRWLAVDLQQQRCVARDPEGAEIRFGAGRTYRARQLEANYVTYEVRSYFGRFVQEGEPVGRR